ncbi:MAG: YkgJ family cysteine cluster protein [Proteobacteria bacterium]|nr:YkgJ family cysteine cluster protein [Pseudomonadota bacterium]
MKTVEIAKPSSWVRFKPSMCRGCWAGCCTMPVQVTSEELYHMGFLEARQVNGPLKRISQKLIKAGIIKSYNSRNRLFRLKQRENGDCVFLDSNRLCTIYENRPSICRGFPFNSVRPGFCPSQRKKMIFKTLQKNSSDLPKRKK